MPKAVAAVDAFNIIEIVAAGTSWTGRFRRGVDNTKTMIVVRLVRAVIVERHLLCNHGIIYVIEGILLRDRKRRRMALANLLKIKRYSIFARALYIKAYSGRRADGVFVVLIETKRTEVGSRTKILRFADGRESAARVGLRLRAGELLAEP